MKHGNATLDEIRPIVPKSNNGGIDSRAVDAQPKNSNQFQVLKQVCQNFDLWVGKDQTCFEARPLKGLGFRKVE